MSYVRIRELRAQLCATVQSTIFGAEKVKNPVTLGATRTAWPLQVTTMLVEAVQGVIIVHDVPVSDVTTTLLTIPDAAE